VVVDGADYVRRMTASMLTVTGRAYGGGVMVKKSWSRELMEEEIHRRHRHRTKRIVRFCTIFVSSNLSFFEDFLLTYVSQIV